MKKEYDVFISYASQDEDDARNVLSSLETVGLKCFIGKDGTTGGDYWLSALANAIQASCIFIPLISKSYYESDYSRNELQLALLEQKRGSLRIFPYFIEDSADIEMPAEMAQLIGSVRRISRNDVPVGPVLANAIRDALREGFIQKGLAMETPRALDNHCYYHSDRTVVAHCVDCGKNLCRECADRHFDKNGRSIHICDDCLQRRAERDMQRKALKIEERKRERQVAIDAAKEEREIKSSKFFIKLFISILIGVLIVAALISDDAPSGAYWLLLLSFFPYGFMAALAGFDAGTTPTVKYSDGTTNGGCLTGILLGLLGGVVGGIFIFFRDMFDLISTPSIEEIENTATELSVPSAELSEPESNATKTKSFTAGQLVVIKGTEDQFRIASVSIKQGERLYWSEKYRRFYRGDEIEDYDLYWQRKKANSRSRVNPERS